MSEPPQLSKFSKLTHDSAQIAFNQLHALLDSFPELNDAQRRQQLLDYAASTRQRLLRLLVGVRWSLVTSSYHESAMSVNVMATKRSLNLTEAADSLFEVNSLARGAGAGPSAVGVAAEVLGNGISPYRLPRVIERSINIDLKVLPQKRSKPDDPDEDITRPPVKRGSRVSAEEEEAIMRLRLETRHAVRLGLPAGIRVLSWCAAPQNIAVRIGIPDAWFADVVLDSPNLQFANFRVLDLKVLIRTDPDAFGTPRRSASEEPLPISQAEYSQLVYNLEDRVSWAVKDATKDASKETSAKESMKTRFEAGLHCLCMSATRDVCTSLIMHFLREQAVALTRHKAWRTSKPILRGVLSQESRETPLSIEYWQHSPFKAKLIIGTPLEEGYIKSDSPSAKGKVTEIVSITHEPNLPIIGPDVSLNLKSLNVESLLLSCARRRALIILARIFERLQSKVKNIITTSVATHSACIEAVTVNVAKTRCSFVFGMALKSGAFTVRLCGNISNPDLSRTSAFDRVQRSVWNGEKHFKDGVAGVVQALEKVIYGIVEFEKAFRLGASGCFADELIMMNWPPVQPNGTDKGRWKEKCKKIGIEPPFLSADTNNPTRFLSAYSWVDSNESTTQEEQDVQKQESKPSLRMITTPGSLALIKGQEPYHVKFEVGNEDLRATASNSAMWTELRHSNSMQLRRDALLQELASSKIGEADSVDSSLTPSQRTKVVLDKKGLLNLFPAKHAYLTLKSTQGWQLEVPTRANTFDNCQDEWSSDCQSVHFHDGSDSKLVFSYPESSRTSLTKFRSDYFRAARLARFGQALSEARDFVKILVRTPRVVSFACLGFVVHVSWNERFRMKVKYEEGGATISHCAEQLPLLEEFLEECWAELAGSVVRYWLEQVLWTMRTVETLCSGGVAKAYRFRHSNVSTLKLTSGSDASYIIDLDLRRLRGYVCVSDLSPNVTPTDHSGSGSRAIDGRTSAGNGGMANGNVKAGNGGRAANSRQSVTIPVPSWGVVVTQFAERGMCRKTTSFKSVFVPKHAVKQFIEALVEGLKFKGT